MNRLTLGFALLCWLGSTCQADEFADRLAEIQSERPADVGRDALIDSYQSLLDAFPEHPDRGESMFRIATLWEITDPAANIQPDYQESLRWLEKAKDATAKDHELAHKVRFFIVGRINRDDPEGAKRLLQEILKNTRSSITVVKVHHERQRIAIQQDDFAEAERICRMLQDWMIDKSRQPESTFAKGKYFEQIQSSASMMMNGWAEANWPFEARKKKIDGLLETYQGRQYMRELHQETIELMEQRR
ncbi:hypothetical protein AB1K70_22585 [Bremerella sp. JC770]|uniref:tetratricopeptide repeat protein n=1 Tax=Bremerella sp. JC770 TaxID=3232137 RepID=UPI003459D31E